MAICAASVARSVVVWSAVAIRRSRMPVRVDDPLVRRVDAPGKLGVGDYARRKAGADPREADRSTKHADQRGASSSSANVSIPVTGLHAGNLDQRLRADDSASHPVDRDGHVEHVARTADAREPHVVDAGEDAETIGVVSVREGADRTDLRRRLDHDDARHDRVAREVAPEEPGIVTDRKPSAGTDARLELDDLVDEQERIAVGNDPLDRRRVQWKLHTSGSLARVPGTVRIGDRILWEAEVSSTQDVIRAAAGRGEPEGLLAMADHQTSGRGRQGRSFLDGAGESLLFSVLLRPTVPIERLPSLSLAAAIAVCQSVAVPATVHWPNDVVTPSGKLAGLLLESELGPSGQVVALGIGINVNTPHEHLPAADRLPATSLRAETGAVCDRLALLRTLCDRLTSAYEAFCREGVDVVAYAAVDGLRSRRIALRLGNGDTVEGVGAGITANGLLVVETADGLRRFASGEVRRVER